MSTTTSTNGFRRLRFTDGDGTDYSRIFSAEYNGRDLGTDTFVTVGTRYEYTIVGDDDVTLRTMRAEGGRRGGVIGARNDHVVFWLTKGRLTMHFADRTRDVEPGSPYIASASEAYRFESTDTVYNGLHLSDPFLRTVGDELGYRLPSGPLLFDQQDASVAQHEPLRRLVHDLAPALLDDRVVGPMRTALNRRLATVVLDTFPIRNRGVDVPVANRLRDAIRYIETHAADRPAVPEIAAACGLSQRGLQDVFARTLGTTPNRFLRDHRLDGVRRELLHGGTEDGVTPVARRWGFTNPGRFAAAYRERFGEDPAATLRSSRAARPESGRSSWRVRRAVAHIEQHADADLTVEQIADAAGVRPRRLQQLFQEECGQSPMAYLRAMRERARRNPEAGIGGRA
ncbi:MULTISPECIES: helix-turn-helix domain-containing protein [unclassified Curtobacterium]|uniref:AraC family transcriptional regulator n=1 Tax=unclassified Curtobacterium TaxID=257496 RepID=UPI0008DE8FA6|nr:MULTISPECIES: helix-turn-helix domain-containing protein [unclassified Curtobacterium]WIA96205.1 helix-turn-helix domain-containing protein [Curtobacterium sp. MCBA15_004]WIA99507.1 helix-turn-helix domain-containing protein [Curtobacterium sp. MCBA15_012]